LEKAKGEKRRGTVQSGEGKSTLAKREKLIRRGAR